MRKCVSCALINKNSGVSIHFHLLECQSHTILQGAVNVFYYALAAAMSTPPSFIPVGQILQYHHSSLTTLDPAPLGF